MTLIIDAALPVLAPVSTPSSRKPMCEMVEYASMRLRLPWAMATTLPTAIDSTASMINMPCHWSCKPPRLSASSLISMAKAGILGAVLMYSVTGVAAPCRSTCGYPTSITAPSLKATPTMMNETANINTTLSCEPCARKAPTLLMSRLPVTPYRIDMPYSSKPVDSAPSTKYLSAASEATPESRCNATSAYSDSDSSSSPRKMVRKL